MSGEPLALYVHWPFCVSKCPYCDFNSHVRASIDQDAWREALLADLAHEARLLPGRQADLDLLRRRHAVADGAGDRRGADRRGAASTGRPRTTSRSRSRPIPIRSRRRASPISPQPGVNRAVARPAELRRRGAALPRPRPLGARRACARWRPRRAHFARVSFDLIYALPGDTEDSWSATLAQALSLGTTHLSLYQLTIEPGTRFAAMVAQGRARAARRRHGRGAVRADRRHDVGGRPARLRDQQSRAAGQESRHNLTYWRYGDYAGVGPGAHGRRLGMRTVRHRKPENFLSALARNGHGIVEEAPLVADRSGRRGAGHGPAACAKASTPTRSPSASASTRSSTGAGRPARRLGSPRARRRAHRADRRRPPAARLTSSARSPRVEA